MIRTHVHLTARQLTQLRQLSQQTGLPTSELVRRAIDHYLAQLPGNGATNPSEQLGTANFAGDGHTGRRPADEASQ